MREFGEIAQDDRRIGADVVLFAQFLQSGGHVAFHQSLEQVDRAHAIGQAQHLPDVFGAHQPGRMRDGLIEERQGIAHRAFRCARDQCQRRRLDLDFFFLRDVFEMLDQEGGIDAPQIEALAARQYRHRHLANFRGGENELGVRRRLFERLEQRVECSAGQHVHFVEDVDLVARAHRRVADGVVDLAHVVDAVVRGGIHLQHVRVSALDDRLAMHAHHRHSHQWAP